MARDPGFDHNLANFISRYWAGKLAEMPAVPRALAEQYAQRASMDGEVVQRSGEIIPKESV